MISWCTFRILILSIQIKQNFKLKKMNELYFSQKETAAQSEVALSYHGLDGLYFLVVVFVATIVAIVCETK